jgi:hypothetical protein
MRQVRRSRFGSPALAAASSGCECCGGHLKTFYGEERGAEEASLFLAAYPLTFRLCPDSKKSKWGQRTERYDR